MDNIHEEDKKVIELILEALANEADRNIAQFHSDFSEDYEDMWEWDEDDEDDEDDEEDKEAKKYTIKGRVRTYSLKYTGKGKSGSAYLKYTPVFGTVSIHTSECYQDRDIKVGWGPDNKEIKIEFMKLWHKVNQWQAVEIPRREREKFINGVVKVFPHLLDEIILGGEHEDKED